ncbi:MAG: hypothetical protein ACRENE_25405 [Polyangiaceae bacterium]
MPRGARGVLGVVLVVAGAALLAAARPEIVTISGDLGDVSLRAWAGYVAGLLMMAYGISRSLRVAPRHESAH